MERLLRKDEAMVDKFSEFLDKVDERIAELAKERDVPGISRVANVWRLNSAEASIILDPSSNELVVTTRCGPDASRAVEHKAGTVESTADEIVERLDYLTHAVN
jgi:hypothetical protein